MAVTFSSNLTNVREYQKDQPASDVSGAGGATSTRLEPARLKTSEQSPVSILRGQSMQDTARAAPSASGSPLTQIGTDLPKTPEPLGAPLQFMAMVDLDDSAGLTVSEQAKDDLNGQMADVLRAYESIGVAD